jgi:hypothetical protein
MYNRKESAMRNVFLILILVVFASLISGETVTLAWNANTEPDLAGYHVYYGTVSRGTKTDPNNFFYEDCMRAIPKARTTITIDKIAPGQTFYFGVTAYDTAGNESSFSNEVSMTGAVVRGQGDLRITELTLERVFPNPFSPKTTIDFTLASDSRVELSIYNAQGKMVKRLVKGKLLRGNHSYKWNAKGLSSGHYFYRLRVGELVSTRKMVLVK